MTSLFRFVFELDSRGCTPRFSTGSRTPGMSTVSSENSYGFITPATTPKAECADTSKVSTSSVTPARGSTSVTPSKGDTSTSTSATPECYALRRTASAPAFLQSLSGLLDSSFASIEMEYDDLDSKMLAPLKIPRKRADSLSLQAVDAAKKDDVTNVSITSLNEQMSESTNSRDVLTTSRIEGSVNKFALSIECDTEAMESDQTREEKPSDSSKTDNVRSIDSAKNDSQDPHNSNSSIKELPKDDSTSQSVPATSKSDSQPPPTDHHGQS